MKILPTLVAIALAVTLAGAALAQTPQSGGTLRVGIIEDPATLDPHKTSQLTAHLVFRLLYDRLVYIDDQRQPQPWLAESWEISDDGRVITFRLFGDTVFHDGTPLTADSVKFTYDRLLDPETASPTRNLMVGSLESIEVVDPLTVAFTFAQPFAPFFLNLYSGYMGIVPEGIDQQSFGRNPVGSGPFMFERWDVGSQVILKRNPDYHTNRTDLQNRAAPYVDQVVFRVVPEEGTRIAALETGELDIVPVPLEDAARLEADPSVSIVAWEEATNYLAIEFNPHKPPFDEVDVRRAIGFAVDAEEIVFGAWSGYATANGNPVGIGHAGHAPDIAAEYGFSFDPERAAAMLDAAGWTLGNGGVRQRDGESLRVLMYLTGNPAYVRAGQIIQAQLADVGVAVDLEVVDAGAFRDLLRGQNQHFNLQRWNWVDPVLMSFVYLNGGIVGIYDIERLNPVLRAADAAVVWEEREPILRDAQRILLEEGALVPILTEYIMVAVRDGVQDYRWDALGYEVWNDVWLEAR